MPENNNIVLNYGLNLDMLAERFGQINKAKSKLEELKNTSREKFFSEGSTEQYAARAALQLALQALLDIVGHVLTRIPDTKQASYRENVSQLGEKGGISSEFIPTAEKMAGYRSRLVHYYMDVDPQELYQILQTQLEDIDTFKHQLAVFVDEHKNDTDFLIRK